MRALRVALLVPATWVLAAACGGGASENGPPPPGAGSDAAVDAPPGAPVCTVALPGNAGLLISGRLLLPAGPLTGELLVDATGTIACAAASCASSAGYAAATHVACPNGVVSPALINTHDHTEYATVGPEAHGTIRYEHRNDWRTGAEGATPLPTVESTNDSATIAAQELRLVLGGGTSIVGSGGVEGLARNLAEYTDPNQLGGLTGQPVFFETFPLGDSNGVLITSGCAYPDIIAASEAFSSGVFAPHIAEGINLAAENELTCASQSSNDLVTSHTSVIHGVGFNANDVNVVKTAGARLIWSPRSNISLYGNTAPVTEYQYASIPIALGTEWLPPGSMNMLRELSCADSLNQKYFNATFSDQQLWQMVTSTAAIASGFDGQIGTLEAGKIADVAVFDGTTNQDYRAVIAAGVEDVHLVLRGGKPLYGDADLVGGIAEGCVPLQVCGIARSVCFDVPGITLDQVQAAATAIYPLFSCSGAPPPGEPTCIPYRDTYPNGISTTDRDGDGVPDATDDCPDIFNPPRPMDPDNGTAQADVDHDGYGDACDAQPLNPAAH
jgi:cytosine/adenosine deaminase-related metal-dependent hydrolase